MSDQGVGNGGLDDATGGGAPPPPPPIGGVPTQSVPPAYGSSSAGGFAPPASSATSLASDPNYPVTAGFDAPFEVARWRVIGNYILAIPHLIVLYVLVLVSEVLALVGWFAILFTGELPSGIGTFIAGVHRYQWRVVTYLLFLRETYPSFTLPSGYAEPGGDLAWFNVTPPQSYSRIAVLLRIFYAIPQLLFGFVMAIGLYVALIIGFFAVLFTGRWPEGLRKFVVGVEFWATRFNAWYFLLADAYPPFTIN
jgi:Domain of unknown function (DUF4389)